jgi:thiopeptide-type bacteriocin biosynthesis protein
MEIPYTLEMHNPHQRRRTRLDGADFQPHRFFLLRTPLLPYDELEAWGAGLRAPDAISDPTTLQAAIEADRKKLRGWLRELLSRPVVIEALHIASPGLFEALEQWHRDPDSKKGQRAEESLARYALRMAARSTPFGMFAGCSLGRVGEPSRLQLAPQSSYRRHSRLDMGYLFSLAEELNQDHELRRSLRYRPSSSLYRAAGRLRYAEARYSGKDVDYHLVVVEPDDFLEAALARAAEGATPGEVAAAVAASDQDGEISVEEAETYVHELIDSQLLMSELWPAVTGPEAVHGLIEVLERIPGTTAGAAAARLRRAHEALEELDRSGLGADPRRYGEIADGLEPLPRRADRRRLYQVDLYKPAEVSLDPAVLDEIAHGIEVLHRFAVPNPAETLETFSHRFVERYGAQRLVSLAEAVDDEAGVGLPAMAVGADNSPLLQGLDFSRTDAAEKVHWGAREGLLLGKLLRARSDGASEIVIDDDDIERLATPRRIPVPDAFQAWATLAAADEDALAAGDFLVWIKTAFGPSGARVAGRFCHGDAEIACAVSEHLRAEEALDPDVVFAEVVHVPSGRLGNIASRPVLREYEIPYLGISGAPRERQIPVEDLLVTVEGSQVVLYSRRLRRRVMPRLTSAHNFSVGSLAVYRFLGLLQAQGVRPGINWQWRRPFEMLPFLPRVRCGRAILSRAQWVVPAEEIKDLAARRGADRYVAARRWRERHGIPRRIALGEDDMELLIDFDNTLSLDVFLADVKKSADIMLKEFWPDFDALPVRGPEGRFVNELIIPFARHRAPTRRRGRPFSDDEAERIFPPTSSWLYLKLYTGSATADVVLRETIAPLVSRALQSGAADRWFFLRYNDPQNHLRVRFGGDPARLRALVDWLPEFLDPLLHDGRIWKWQLDTYEREIERYGGPESIEISEWIFTADSELVLAALDELEGDRGADWRWRLALVGIDRLLADFGFDLAARRDLTAALRRGFGEEFAVGADLTQQLAQRLREHGEELYSLLTAGTVAPEHPLAGSLAALDRRSAKLAPLVAQLRALESEGKLTAPVESLVTSYLHMFVNRLIRSDARAHELVLYDLLHRLTVSRLARTNAAPAEPTPQGSGPMPAPAS